MGFLDSIVKGIGGALTDLPGTLIGGAMDMFSAKQAYDRSEGGSRDAFNMSQAAYNQRYQNTARDMKAAGLNPILAATGGFSVGNSPTMAPPQNFSAPGHYMGGSAASAREVATTEKTEEETKRTAAETAKIIKELDLVVEQTQRTREEILKTREDTKVATQTERNLVTTMFNLEQDFLRKIKEIDKTQQEIYLLEAQRGQTLETTKQVQALTQKVADDRALVRQMERQHRYDADKLEKTTAVYRGQLGDVVGGMRSAVETFSPFIKR